MIFKFVRFSPTTYGDYQFPLWSDIAGWFVVLAEIAFVPGVAIYKVCTADPQLTIIQVRNTHTRTHRKNTHRY